MYVPGLQEIAIRLRNRVTGGLAIPRPRYINSVAGTADVTHFLESGRHCFQAIEEMLRANGADPRAIGDVLEFGCGSGRLLRHWTPSERVRLHGTDYNPDLISWCERHFTHGRFAVNPLDGPMPYPDTSFDFGYAWSVFTHLSEELGDHWISELARVLRPGGLLLTTFHGEFYVSFLSRPEQRAFAAGEIVVHRPGHSGSNACAAFHPPGAVREKFASRFDLVDFVAGRPPHLEQDRYLWRKRPDRL